MADINQADVELTLGVDMILGNEEEFAEALSNLQNSDVVLKVGGVEKTLGNISQQLLTILQSETEITQKSKEMSNALGSNANNIKTFFETTIGQITSKLKETYNSAQKALDNGKVVEGYSLLQSAKGQAGTLQAISRKYKESFGELPQIEIGDGLYKSDDLDRFIKDLDKASKAQNEFISGYSELKKQLANTSNKAKEDLLNTPAISSMFKNAIASLGTEFKTLEKDINNNINEGNFNGIEEKIKKLANYKAAINKLMNKSGIDWVKAEDTSFQVSVKQKTVNSSFDNILNDASAADKNIDKSIFKQISENASEADENVLKLIEDCFRLEQTVKSNKNNTIVNESTSFSSAPSENKLKKISKKDKDLLDEAIEGLAISNSSDFPEALKILVEQFNKMAQINFDSATKMLTDKLKEEEFISKEQNLKDFENIYKKDLSNIGVSFYKPEEDKLQNFSTTSSSNIDNSVLQAAQEAQKQAEAEAQQYKSQVDNLESQLASKDKELEAINKKVNDLRNQLNQASENSSSERVAQLESEIEKKNKEKTILENEINTLRFQLSEAKTKDNSEDNSAEIEELQKQISAKTKENEDLKKANKELQDSLVASSSDMISGNNNQKIIEQIKKRMEDYDTAFNNDDSLEQQRQILIEINDLYNQLSDNEKTNPDFDYSQSKIQEDLRTVNDLIEEQNKKRQEEIRLADEAKIKESELYKEILKYQKEYDKTQSQDGASLGLNKRKDRKEYQNKLVSAIGNKKKKLQEQYPDFSSDELWSDSKISETKEAISKSLTGLSEKVAYAEEQSLRFVENTEKLFDKYSNKYDNASTSKKKQQVLDEMIEQSNQINNNVIPIEEATQKDLDKGTVATSEAISQMVKKFDDFVLKKQQELFSAQQEVEKTSKVIDQAKNSKKSSAKTDLTTPPSTPQSDSDTASSKPITSSKEFVETMTNRMNKKNNAKSEKIVNEENTDFSKLGSSIDNVTKKINDKTEAIKTEGKTVTEVVNGEISNFERLRKKIEEITDEVNNKNNTLEGSNIDIEDKEASKPSKTSEVQSNTENIVDNNVNNINPFEITDITVTEEAKAKLNTDISNAIATIDTSELVQSIKTEIETALAQLKVPKVGTKVKFTDADQTKFDKLTKAIDKFSEAVERKNQAVDSFIGNEAANIEVLLGKIKELKDVLDSIGKVRVLYERDVSKDTDSNTGADSSDSGSKKDDKKIIGVTSGSDNSSKKQDTKTKDKKEVATQKEKDKLLEEELKIKTKLIPIEEEIKKITEQKENAEKNNNQEEISQLNAQLDIQKAEKYKLTNELQDIKAKKDIYGITKQDEDDFIETKYKKINTTANNEQNAINKGQKNIGIENTKIAKEEFNKITDAIANYDNIIKPTIDDLAKLNSVTKEVIESNQSVRTSIKNNTGENALDTKYERLIAKMKKWASDNPLAMKDDSIFKKYNNILNQLTDTSKRTSDGIAKLEGEFSKLDGQIHETGQKGRTFTGEMKNLFNVLGDRAVVSMVIEGIKDGLRQMVNNVKEIDAAMTELKKVTNETSNTYNNFLKEAGSRASALGSTMTDLISSTADFAKLGYSVKDAAVLAENAIMYSNVGDLDIQTATSDIVSALKAFDIEASNATKIVDSFNEVGNNYAISAQQIGEALQNSASSLVVAGNDIDQSIAMITAMTEITQDASSAGIDLPDNMATY